MTADSVSGRRPLPHPLAARPLKRDTITLQKNPSYLLAPLILDLSLPPHFPSPTSIPPGPTHLSVHYTINSLNIGGARLHDISTRDYIKQNCKAHTHCGFVIVR